MANTVDELITKFTLDPSGYQKGAHTVQDATRSVVGGIDSMLRKALDMGKGVLLSPINAIIGAVGGAGLIGMAKYAVDAAEKFDFLTRSLTAVSGSAARAASIMHFVDRLAIPSIFKSEELAEGAVHLEAFRLQTERFLPIAEKLATVFGGTSMDLMQFVDALGRLRGGETGRALMEFKRAGISTEDLMAKGLQFSGNGELKSSVDQALTAIESIVNDRLGKLSEEMKESPMAKMASVMDAIQRAARSAGFAILSVLAPAVEKVGSFIQYLVDSGTLDKAFNGIARMFSGANLGNGLVNALSWVVATLKDLPVIMLAAEDYLGSLFQFITDNLRLIGAVMIATFTFGPILSSIQLLVKAITGIALAEDGVTVASTVMQAVMSGGASIMENLAAATVALGVGLGIVNMVMNQVSGLADDSGMSAVFDHMKKSQKLLMEKYQDSIDGDGYDNTLNGLEGMLKQQTGAGPLQQIASNTAQIALNTKQALDLKRMSLGGGNLAAHGITPVELNGIKHASASERKMAAALQQFWTAITSFAAESYSGHAAQHARMSF